MPHVGEVGTRFQLVIRPLGGGEAMDISAATVIHLLFAKPSGQVVTQIASFSTDGHDGMIEWTTTTTTDLDESGPWFWQAYLEVPPRKFYTDVLSFDVNANLVT